MKMIPGLHKTLHIMLLCLLVDDAVAQAEADKNQTRTSTIIENNDLAASVNNMGYKLIKEMLKNDENKNIVISPTGIAGLLAMTMLGSVGRSYDELAETLGFSQDVRLNRENHEVFGSLLSELNANDSYSKTIYADALFVDGQSSLREAYRSYLNKIYNGDAMSVDFGDKNTVKTLINEWVSNHTNGKISNFLKEPLPGDSKAVLLTALYFSGQWLKPFTPEYTLKMPFKTFKKEVTANMMLNFGDFNYINSFEDGLHMIAMPYNDSVTTLYALMPRHPDKLNLKDLMNQLNYSKINDLIDKMTNKKSIIRFPKLDLKVGANLERCLKSLGIKSIFIPGQANFALMIDSNTILNKTENELITRINEGESLETKNLREIIDNLPNPGVYVDSIIHDVRITIDEYGTEAVAATSGILARTAELFYADTPFYMFIRNEKTKLVTFSAVIYDPTS